MVRVRTLLPRASANSPATSHHKWAVTGLCEETAWTMPSMISFVIQMSATGNREANTREIRPNVTTPGPDSHTIFSTGGTFRSAARRSCHPLQKVSLFAMLCLKTLKGYLRFADKIG